MNTTAVITDDISNLDPVPSVGLCEWALGTRPVIGAIAASSLMLIACSWFAFNSGVFSPSHDVGGPAPVRIDDATRQHDAAVRTPAAPAARHAHVDIARATNHLGAAIPTPEIRQNSESAPQTVAPVPVARNPASSGTEASSSPSPVAPTSPTAPVTPVTPTLPPTLDDLPEISLPPVTLPVTPPDLPSVPAVSTVTTILGVP